jgi:signal transduction histidine kinase
MARSVVQSLGGWLWHESHSEGGASFFFTLPSTASVPIGEEGDENA